jgi:hypothetical protein
MAEGHMQHHLRQVMPHPWGTDDGVARLRALGLQKGELFKLFLVLPLCNLSGSTLRHKLSLKEGNLSDKAFNILMSRGKCHGVLRLHSQYPLQYLPLYQGGPVFYILDMKSDTVLRRSNLLGRSFYSKYCRDTSDLHSDGYLPLPGHLCQ